MQFISGRMKGILLEGAEGKKNGKGKRCLTDMKQIKEEQ